MVRRALVLPGPNIVEGVGRDMTAGRSQRHQRATVLMLGRTRRESIVRRRRRRGMGKGEGGRHRMAPTQLKVSAPKRHGALQGLCGHVVALHWRRPSCGVRTWWGLWHRGCSWCTDPRGSSPNGTGTTTPFRASVVAASAWCRRRAVVEGENHASGRKGSGG